MSLDLSLHDLGREQDPVQALPEVLRTGPPSVVDHLLSVGQRKILVEAGGFLCVIPVSRDLVFRGLGFVRN